MAKKSVEKAIKDAHDSADKDYSWIYFQIQSLEQNTYSEK